MKEKYTMIVSSNAEWRQDVEADSLDEAKEAAFQAFQTFQMHESYHNLDDINARQADSYDLGVSGRLADLLSAAATKYFHKFPMNLDQHIQLEKSSHGLIWGYSSNNTIKIIFTQSNYMVVAMTTMLEKHQDYSVNKDLKLIGYERCGSKDAKDLLDSHYE